jgi:CRP/FNR family transcriptional regulator, cyclic AMP receptor protein
MRKVFYILTRLNDEDVEWLAAIGRRRRLDIGTVLIRQGQPIEALIFVLDGQVSVTVDAIGEVARLGSGEILGEMSLVDESPPSATVTVTQPTQILSIEKQRLVARLDGDAAFAARFYRAIAMFLSIRMRNTVRRFGYGSASVATEEELDIALLDTVHVAGARFDRMIKELLGSEMRS